MTDPENTPGAASPEDYPTLSLAEVVVEACRLRKACESGDFDAYQNLIRLVVDYRLVDILGAVKRDQAPDDEHQEIIRLAEENISVSEENLNLQEALKEAEVAQCAQWFREWSLRYRAMIVLERREEENTELRSRRLHRHTQEVAGLRERIEEYLRMIQKLQLEVDVLRTKKG